MTASGPIGDDARAIVLLCSSLAMPRDVVTKPLGPKGWARIASRLAAVGLRPADLVGRTMEGLIGVAQDPQEASSLAALLSRSGQLAFELDRLTARGVGVLTVADDEYPGRLRSRLHDLAPPVLYVAGDHSLLGLGGVAIVGSRDVTEADADFARAIAVDAARERRSVVSGGARGIDQVAMQAAFEGGGRVVGILPEGIERRLRESTTRAAVAAGTATIISPYHPAAGFSAGAAMGRNRLIYALADVAVVVTSAAGSGGTWAGATEALEARWVPVFIRRADPTADGNRQLLERGGLPLDVPVAPEVPAGWTEGELAAGKHRKPRTPRAAARSMVEQPTLKLVD